jgi:succinate dehydrogenase/fumarate reductase flavoprotein subunit
MTVDTPRGGGTGVVKEKDMGERRRRRMNGRGRGIIGALLKACLDRGVEPVLGARAIALITERERVVGVRIEKDGAQWKVRARNAVIVATGGFEWNPEMVTAFLRGPMSHPASLPSNSGDGQKMMMRAGAALGMMQEAWWVPALAVPGETQNYGAPKIFLMLGERAHPGSVLVNRRGRRFCNEATNYNAISAAFHVIDPVRFEFANLPCWLVFDQEFVRKYGFFVLGIKPGGEIPDWIARAETPGQLAALLGIDAPGLKATLERWNEQVASGTDPDFARGDSAYDGWNGDMSLYPDRRSTLGPITCPPYYAVEIHSGALGTKGGAQTDRHGAVLDHAGQPIPGLYAAGNAMACVTGMAYGGAGGTLGPAMVFGYLSGRHAARHPHSLREKDIAK